MVFKERTRSLGTSAAVTLGSAPLHISRTLACERDLVVTIFFWMRYFSFSLRDILSFKVLEIAIFIDVRQKSPFREYLSHKLRDSGRGKFHSTAQVPDHT
jgi:hypothetical protein